MTAITKSDIPDYTPARVELPCGWSAQIDVRSDEHMGAPWDEHDGHGPVREGDAKDKRPGERVLDGGYLYDFAAAVKIARKDRWGCTHGFQVEGQPDTHMSKGAMAACAAEEDFQRMRAWATGEWEWIGVLVTVTDADGAESDTDYWREVAAELVNEIISGRVSENFAAETAAPMTESAL